MMMRAATRRLYKWDKTDLRGSRCCFGSLKESTFLRRNLVNVWYNTWFVDDTWEDVDEVLPCEIL